jgi:DNA mismatch repair protein MutS
VIEDEVLPSTRNNFLAAVAEVGGRVGMSLLDLSTGEFWLEEAATLDALLEGLARQAPSEVLLPAADSATRPALEAAVRERMRAVVTPCEEWTFDPEHAHDRLIRHFKVHSLEGFGCTGLRAGVAAAGAVLHYASHQLRNPLGHVRSLRVKNPGDYLLLDEATAGNLELVDPRNPGAARDATLLKLLDTTRTPMGARRLREWLLRPLIRLEAITARHDAVEWLTRQPSRLESLREALGQIKDLERLTARLNAGAGGPRDVLAVALSLEAMPAVKTGLTQCTCERLAALDAAVDLQPELRQSIRTALADEPALSLKDGGVIRPGFHPELDELRRLATEGRDWIAQYQQTEQDRTGIRSLKVRYNKVFGYYIEVTKANLGQVPAEYIRKQTIAGGERYITPELKDYENKILGAHERALQLESEIFEQLRAQVAAQTAPLQGSAAALAEIDALACFAERALALRYARPAMNEEGTLDIREGRHPVIEQLNPGERFVPNDTHLDQAANQLHVITGPNMAGKSTYIRQVALIVILAHTGCFVPAASATIGIVDRVFTRVGASDDLARGRSTFMVEMQESANILNNATPRSLIVLDEIGRGTSTFDGISIAWAVAEFLHNDPRVKAKTLFATHYHELTDLARTLPGVKNYTVMVRESGDRISFLRKIVPGAADKSYGIAVARLAGLPAPVIDRAKEILSNLEEGELNEAGLPKLARRRVRKAAMNEQQLSLFGDSAE